MSEKALYNPDSDDDELAQDLFKDRRGQERVAAHYTTKKNKDQPSYLLQNGSLKYEIKVPKQQQKY